MRGRWSDAEVHHELFTAARRVGTLAADSVVIERPGWFQLITPSFRKGGLNEIAQAELGGDEAAIEAAIDAALAEYQRLGIRFRWRVDPSSTPADLGERLARRGMSSSETIGMARSTAPLAGAPPPGVEVVRVGAAEVDEYTRLTALGWSVDPGPLDRFHRQILGDPGCPTALFLARADGEPAGVAAVELRATSAFLLGAVVLPEQRGRGVYRALLGARLAHGAAAGVELAVTHAIASTSAPILARVGFEEVVRFAVYHWAPSDEG